MLERLKGHLARGEYATVKALAQGMVLSSDVTPEDKGTAALLAVQSALTLGEGLIACAFANRALGLAQEHGMNILEGRALFWLGTAKLGVGDFAQARTFLSQYLAGLTDQWGELDDELTGHAHMNVGQVYREQRLYADSLKAYAQALTRFQQTGDLRNQVATRHQMAWILIRDRAYDEAKEHLDATASMGDLPADSQTHQLCHEALLHLFTGNHTGATTRATEVLHPNRPNTNAGHRAIAAYVAGSVALAVGHLDDAKHFAEVSHDYAIDSGWATHINLAIELKQKLHVATSTPDS